MCEGRFGSCLLNRPSRLPLRVQVTLDVRQNVFDTTNNFGISQIRLLAYPSNGLEHCPLMGLQVLERHWPPGGCLGLLDERLNVVRFTFNR